MKQLKPIIAMAIAVAAVTVGVMILADKFEPLPEPPAVIAEPFGDVTITTTKAPIPTTSAGVATTAPLTEDDVRAAQAALGVPADGVVGPVTIAAIEAFQSGAGLPVTGEFDELTWLELFP